MVNEEIVSGLSNAVARGESLESAMTSFLAAGYSQEEVLEASRQINMGTSQNVPASMQEPSKSAQVLQSNSSENSSTQPMPSFVEPKPKTRLPKWLVILIIILGVAAVLVTLYMLFGQKIMGMFSGG